MDFVPRSSIAQSVLSRAIVPAGLAAPALAPLIWPESPALAIGAILGAHLPLAYGTFMPNRQLFGPVVTGFAGAPDEFWLTIDDGPDPGNNARILDVLDVAGARATFFLRGDRARAHPDLVREIVRRGHDLGNHTDSHPERTFWGLPPARIARQMDRCSAALVDIAGVAPRWFRTPVGFVNPFVHCAAHRRGMRVIGWSARAYDAGRAPVSPEEVCERIDRDLRPGGIVLLHEGVPAAGPNVELVLARMRERGMHAVIPREADLRAAGRALYFRAFNSAMNFAGPPAV